MTRVADPRFTDAKPYHTNVAERLSVRNSINNLRTFPYIREREADGRLKVHGAWFDISTGELWVMDNETGDFSRPELPAATA